MLSPPQAGTTERQARFEALYAANHAPILGYALRRTTSPDDAADVLAETFLAAWRRLDELPSGDDATLWLYGVARRVLASYYRGERRRSALADRLRAELASSYVPREFDARRRSSPRRPLSEVLPLLAQHGVTVAQCFIDNTFNRACDPSAMPGNWYVHDPPVYGGNQVIAIIGRD